MNRGRKIGVNGLGRIGKLTVWHHLARKYFSEIVVNIGRQAGGSIEDIAHYMERDSTYGSLGAFLYGGCQARPVIRDVSDADGTMTADGTTVTVLRSHRNPCEIRWEEYGVELVVDTTGRFRDPTLSPDHPEGSLRGHLQGGAKRVIVSAPFKIKDKRRNMPQDAVTTVMGINENDYDPRLHRIISAASCTTTCLAHMIKPLIDHFGHQKILSASMATIHAVTGSQEVLDRLPDAGAKDLRKNRSVINNIILTTTGAADTLRLVIPEMSRIGFIAESVRIPISTGSLIILVVNLQDELMGSPISRELINDIYRQASSNGAGGYLCYTEKQNVSGDIIGMPKAAAIIEGHETHRRTAEVAINLEKVPELDKSILSSLKTSTIRIPITQAVIYGWYDNELGSYVHMLGDRTVTIDELL